MIKSLLNALWGIVKRHKWISLIIVLLAIGGGSGWQYYQQYGTSVAFLNQPRTNDQRLSALETWRVSLREEIDKEIQNHIPKSTFSDADFEKISQQVDKLQADVSRFEKAAELVQRNLPVWLLAYGQLSITLKTSAPFMVQYQTLLMSSQGNPEIINAINPLAVYANTGVPTQQLLSIEFGAIATQILRENAGVGNSWISRLQRFLASMLLIRRVDLADGGGSDTQSMEYILEKAQRLMDANDWSAVIATLSEAPTSNATLQNFINRAKSRQQVNAIMEAMDNRIITVALMGTLKK